MAGNHDSDIADMTAEFERDLEQLLLEAFASGVPIEGTWVFASKPEAVPDWSVRIEQCSRRPDRDDSGEVRPNS